MDFWYFHATWETGAWIIGAMVGIVLNGYMIGQAQKNRAVARGPEERRIVLGDFAQWGFGLFVKIVGFLFGFWLLLLPMPGMLPEIDLQRWAIEHGRTIIIWSMLVMMYGMDVRDSILVSLHLFSHRRLRSEVEEYLTLEEELARVRAENLQLRTRLAQTGA